MKENFLLKKNQGEIFEALEDSEAGKLIKGIFKYVNTGDSGLEGSLKAIFISIKIEIDNNEKKYKERCETNKINGAKGGAPKGNKNAKKEKTTENNQTVEKTTENNMNNHIHIHNNHLENKKDNNRGMGEEEEKEETFKNAKKVHFAEFVTMTNAEYEELVSTYGREFADQCIEKLDNYKGSSGKIYKNDYRAIKNWVVDIVHATFKNVPVWFGKKQEGKSLSSEEQREMDDLLKSFDKEEMSNVKSKN